MNHFGYIPEMEYEYPRCRSFRVYSIPEEILENYRNQLGYGHTRGGYPRPEFGVPKYPDPVPGIGPKWEREQESLHGIIWGTQIRVTRILEFRV